MKKIIIIGGGASGLICAIKAKNDNNEVIVLERNDKAGKKLLLTGNGRCNYWHDGINKSSYFSESKDSIDKIINQANINDTYFFLEKLGFYPNIKNGYYYPYSNTSKSILTILLKECEKKGIQILYNTLVNKIIKKDNMFIINDKYKADILVIACGLKSYPKTGSDGVLLPIINDLGHRVISVLPGLTSLVTNVYHELDGLRCTAKVTLMENDKHIDCEEGEVQFTPFGLSGICIMNLSNYISKGLNNNLKDDIYLNFLPFIDDYDSFINDRIYLMDNPSVSDIFESLLNYKLLNLILKISKIDPNDIYNNLSIEKKNILKNNIISMKFNVSKVSDFDKAQVCLGGVSLDEVNDSLMSKNNSNLYFTGEVLDIAGKCGGYNLANAFITGYIVGSEIHDKN